MDNRMEKVADLIVRHSLHIQPGERVLIDATDDCEDLIVAVLQKTYEVGGFPTVVQWSSRVRRIWLLGATDEQMSIQYMNMYQLRKEMDCILTIRSQGNGFEFSDVPAETLQAFTRMNSRLGKEARKSTLRTTLIRYPTPAFAQQCGLSTEAFEDYFHKVCTINYQVLHREMEPLKSALDKANHVRLVSTGTDLSFSIKGMDCFISTGTWNIPDGETAMDVVRESVNGRISYNVPTFYQGYLFRDISFIFKEGRIIAAEANDSKRLNGILDTDEGARYIGEFAIGVHPFIRTPVIDTLFDEKMAGSLHFTPGGDDANGQRSSVHWDIVQSHMPELGGGEIYLDGKLWRKDGLFVDDALGRLNPNVLSAILQAAESP